jgi:hypothetical protein
MIPAEISVQDRDLALLRGLLESRAMTVMHAAALCFGGSKEAAKKRLQKLKKARLIGERERRPYEPAILFLTRKGFMLLRERGILAEYPRLHLPVLFKRARVSPITLHHELEVMDVKAAFHSAIKPPMPYEIVEFSTWPLLNEFEVCPPGHAGTGITVKPDGFIRIHEKEADGGLSEHTFCLEVDRSSEIQDTLAARAGCYFNYYKSGGFAVRNGAERSAFKEYPFRVLMVFKTAERRNNTAERLLQSTPPIFTHVCLSTFAEVTRNPLGPIWFCPADYRDTTKGTPFGATHRPQQWGYKRQTAREVFVEQKVRKWRILVNEPAA